KAQAQRLFTAQVARCEKYFGGAARAYQLQQPSHLAVPDKHSEPRGGDAKAAPFSGDAQISAASQLEPATEAKTADHRDRGLVQRIEGVQGSIECLRVAAGCCRVVPTLAKFGDVGACRECVFA